MATRTAKTSAKSAEVSQADAIQQALALLSKAGVDVSKVKVPATPMSLDGRKVIATGGELSKSEKTVVYRISSDDKAFGGQIWVRPEWREASGFNGQIEITIRGL